MPPKRLRCDPAPRRFHGADGAPGGGGERVCIRAWSAMAAAVITLGTAAAAYEVPARGAPVRSAIMDALRPGAEALYGAPVQFVVDDLRVAGGVAFASVRAQRPGGLAIELERTPGFARGELDEEADWTLLQSLLRRTASGWSPAHLASMPSEAWWLDSGLCPEFGVVLPGDCR